MIQIKFYALWRLKMTWTEIKIEGYDFCIESGEWQVRRKGEQIGLWYSLNGQFDKYCCRVNWCGDISDGMFRAWVVELREKRKNE